MPASTFEPPSIDSRRQSPRRRARGLDSIDDNAHRFPSTQKKKKKAVTDGEKKKPKKKKRDWPKRKERKERPVIRPPAAA